MEKKGLKLSVTENGKEGKSKMIASCDFLENGLRQFSKEEGVTFGRWRGNFGRRLENKSKKAGSQRKSEKEEVQCEGFHFKKKSKAFQKNNMKAGVKKLSRAGMMPARNWGAHAVVMSPTER